MCFYPFLFGDDKGIALYYFRQAEILYNSGKLKEAEKLLMSSYAFYPDSSETTFLLSLIYFKDQRTTLAGLSYLKQALNDNTWIKTDLSIAIILCNSSIFNIPTIRQSFIKWYI